MEFRIADTFTASLSQLTGGEQKAVKTIAFDLQLPPANPSRRHPGPLLIYYLIAVRGRFQGPIPQAVSETELLRIESEYEASASAQ